MADCAHEGSRGGRGGPAGGGGITAGFGLGACASGGRDAGYLSASGKEEKICARAGANALLIALSPAGYFIPLPGSEGAEIFDDAVAGVGDAKVEIQVQVFHGAHDQAVLLTEGVAEQAAFGEH